MKPEVSTKGAEIVTRKPYQKPKMEQVRLVPEQAVLSICKNAISAGPSSNDCTDVGGTPCVDIGS